MKRFILILLAITLFACNKSNEKREDWQLVDDMGNSMGIVYNKTESELLNCTTCGTFNGKTRLGDALTSCNYYKVSEPTFCWKVGDLYYKNLPEKFIKCFIKGNATKVDCATVPNCEFWYTRTMWIVKAKSDTFYSSTLYKNYCNSDTLKLFGNSATQIIIKNDTDSLVVLQRTKDVTTRFY